MWEWLGRRENVGVTEEVKIGCGRGWGEEGMGRGRDGRYPNIRLTCIFAATVQSTGPLHSWKHIAQTESPILPEAMRGTLHK